MNWWELAKGSESDQCSELLHSPLTLGKRPSCGALGNCSGAEGATGGGGAVLGNRGPVMRLLVCGRLLDHQSSRSQPLKLPPTFCFGEGHLCLSPENPNAARVMVFVLCDCSNCLPSPLPHSWKGRLALQLFLHRNL